MRGEIVDGAPHPVDRPTSGRHLRRSLSLERRIGRRQLEVGGRNRERRAQLVDDLVEQLALLVAARVESIEHVIDSRREASELVVTGIEVDAFIRLAAVDPLDDLGDLVHGLQHLARNEPARARPRARTTRPLL